MLRIKRCLHCQLRTEDCHSRCQKYIEEKKAAAEEKERAYLERKNFMITNCNRYMYFGEPKRKERYR